jgi:hypothetical protein
MRTVLTLAALLPLAVGPSHASHGEAAQSAGAAEKKDAKPAEGEEKKGEGKDGAASKPQYKLGQPLDGHFDRYTLRSTRNVASFRYPLKDIVKSLNLDRPWQIRMGCAVEFGSESGMAEIAANHAACQVEILNAIERFTPQQLLTPGGKLRLKEAIIAGLNRRLATARVRQVYLTDFVVLQGI